VTCMKQPHLRLESLTTLPDIERLAPDWERLLAEDKAEGFFRSLSWYLSWIQHIRPDTQPLVLAVRHDDKVVAIAPFCLRKQHGCLRVLSLAGSDVVCGEYLDIVAHPEFRTQALHCIWSNLLSGRSRWDMMSLNAIRGEGDLHWEAQNRAVESGLMIRSEEQVCPFIELPSTFEEYLGRLSRKRRKHFGRAMRIFREKGIEIRTYTEPHELGAAIDRLIDLHTLRWKTLGKPGTLGQPGFREFLKNLAGRQNKAGTFRVYVLEEGGVAKAALLNFHCGSSALQFQNGFDPHWALAQHSPGTVLVLHAIREALEAGIGCYDFLRGAEDYKFQFATRCRPTTNVFLARTLRARIYLLLKDLRATLGRYKQSLGNSKPSAAVCEWIFVSE